jgi:TonB-dependent receptor
MSAPALAQDKTQAAPEPVSTDEMPDIVVSGIRASLENSINQKRNSDGISDSITAEDIGNLPDTNVAESLQRIPGVQIVRDTAASRETRSGQTVAIRGLPSLAIVNGRILSSSFNSRDFDFRGLPSDIFSELIISKTPTADQIEGGLGGVIQLNTRKPLQRDGSVTSLSVEGIYRDYSKKVTPGVSALISRRLFDNRLGVLLAGSFQKTETRTDQFYVRSGYEVRNFANSGFDFNNNGAADVITPGDLRLNTQNDHQERIGFDATIQFAATDNLDFTLTGTWARHARERVSLQSVLRHQFNGDVSRSDSSWRTRGLCLKKFRGGCGRMHSTELGYELLVLLWFLLERFLCCASGATIARRGLVGSRGMPAVEQRVVVHDYQQFRRGRFACPALALGGLAKVHGACVSRILERVERVYQFTRHLVRD